MIAFLTCLLLGYLLGSISGALVLGGLRGVDIRQFGSGNAGGTNALRTQGPMFAAGVLTVDFGKGVLAAGLLPLIAPWAGDAWLDRTGGMDHTVLAATSGVAAVLGHVWPLYFRFRGGKGAATAVGATAALAPWCLAPFAGVWLLVLLVTGYAGLATVLAGLSLVPAMWWLGPRPLPAALAAFSVAIPALLLYTHRSNLRRLAAGSENRFEKARLFRRR